jgi:hypothetical protein
MDSQGDPMTNDLLERLARVVGGKFHQGKLGFYSFNMPNFQIIYHPIYDPLERHTALMVWLMEKYQVWPEPSQGFGSGPDGHSYPVKWFPRALSADIKPKGYDTPQLAVISAVIALGEDNVR